MTSRVVVLSRRAALKGNGRAGIGELSLLERLNNKIAEDDSLAASLSTSTPVSWKNLHNNHEA